MSPFFRGSVRPAKKHPRAWSTNPRLNPDMLGKQQQETGTGTAATPRFSILGLPSQPTDVLLPVFNGVYLKPLGVEVVEEAAAEEEVHGQYHYNHQRPKPSGQQAHHQQLQPPAIIQNVALRSVAPKRTEAAAYQLAAHKPHVAEIVVDDGEDNEDENDNNDDETAHVPASAAGQGEETRAETLPVAPTNVAQDMDIPTLTPTTATATAAGSLKSVAPTLQNQNHQQLTRTNDQGPPTLARVPDTAAWPLPAEPVGLSTTGVWSSSSDNGQESSTATPQAAMSAPSLSEKEDESRSHGFKAAAPELEAVGVLQPVSPVPEQPHHQISVSPEHEAASATSPSSPIEPETIDGPALVKASPVEEMSPISEEPQTGTGTGGGLFENAMPIQPPPAPVEDATLPAILEEEQSEQPQNSNTAHFDEDELRGVVNHQHHHPTTSTASFTSSTGILAGNEPLVTDEQLKVGDEFRPSVNVMS